MIQESLCFCNNGSPFLFTLLIPLNLHVYSQDLSFESTILLSLKQNWSNPTSLELWNSTSLRECTSGSVTGLFLAGKRMRVTIPDDIRNLYNLIKLDLSMNSFSGTIPWDCSMCIINCTICH